VCQQKRDEPRSITRRPPAFGIRARATRPYRDAQALTPNGHQFFTVLGKTPSIRSSAIRFGSPRKGAAPIDEPKR